MLNLVPRVPSEDRACRRVWNPRHAKYLTLRYLTKCLPTYLSQTHLNHSLPARCSQLSPRHKQTPTKHFLCRYVCPQLSPPPSSHCLATARCPPTATEASIPPFWRRSYSYHIATGLPTPPPNCLPHYSSRGAASPSRRESTQPRHRACRPPSAG